MTQNMEALTINQLLLKETSEAYAELWTRALDADSFSPGQIDQLLLAARRHDRAFTVIQAAIEKGTVLTETQESDLSFVEKLRKLDANFDDLRSRVIDALLIKSTVHSYAKIQELVESGATLNTGQVDDLLHASRAISAILVLEIARNNGTELDSVQATNLDYRLASLRAYSPPSASSNAPTEDTRLGQVSGR